MLKLEEDTADSITLNPTGVDMDATIRANSNIYTLFSDGGNGALGLGAMAGLHKRATSATATTSVLAFAWLFLSCCCVFLAEGVLAAVRKRNRPPVSDLERCSVAETANRQASEIRANCCKTFWKETYRQTNCTICCCTS